MLVTMGLTGNTDTQIAFYILINQENFQVFVEHAHPAFLTTFTSSCLTLVILGLTVLYF